MEPIDTLANALPLLGLQTVWSRRGAGVRAFEVTDFTVPPMTRDYLWNVVESLLRERGWEVIPSMRRAECAVRLGEREWWRVRVSRRSEVTGVKQMAGLYWVEVATLAEHPLRYARWAETERPVGSEGQELPPAAPGPT